MTWWTCLADSSPRTNETHQVKIEGDCFFLSARFAFFYTLNLVASRLATRQPYHSHCRRRRRHVPILVIRPRQTRQPLSISILSPVFGDLFLTFSAPPKGD